MPLPEDKQLLKLSDELVETIRATFDTPKNYRPVHAKGQLVKGYFTPHKDASKLSKAPIFTQPSTPLIMRYSTDTGFKNLPDNGENGSRGFAIRFVLSEDGHTHYDIITNNAYGFVVSTGEGFLDQFKAMRDDKMEEFLDKYPHARYFMENQSPAHSYSFATEQWHSIHAYKFVNDEGKERYFRWRIVPWQGVMKHSKADAAKQGKNYQFDDLEYRLSHNKPIKYRLMAQLAEEGDEVNDSTKVWPETNEFAEMGEIVIDRLWEMDEGEPAGREQKRIIYDPIPRYMEGVGVSEDPLLEVRTAVYLISGRIRREHIQEEVQQAVK
ncbi:heme-dependent catalase [Aureobasidium pullulans]|uniref:Heme-dependent catalase n=2 Tax=Aureobasidium pullulans TaxID=5580 RepID=A0A074XAW2_AURPU|nr:heme-dependent catalase [Aureobasidium pullulans EXF-150]KEQ82508.1 heme-dependent catalase [Aureobasidium pullulans EXF-150]TIA33903.1 heme-dependent catalase [Aureobasidium pullulans]